MNCSIGGSFTVGTVVSYGSKALVFVLMLHQPFKFVAASKNEKASITPFSLLLFAERFIH